jgi:tRNA(adenine34) deaminase
VSTKWSSSPSPAAGFSFSAVADRTLPSVDAGRLHDLMGVALEEARVAAEHGDVPIGAVVAVSESGEIVARRHNQREQDCDPTAHAEILALRDAAQSSGSWRLDGCGLVVTLEPCPMCAGAVVAARLDLVAFGAADPKAGALGSLYNLSADPRLNHEAAVVDGVRAAECSALLSAFFADRR